MMQSQGKWRLAGLALIPLLGAQLGGAPSSGTQDSVLPVPEGQEILLTARAEGVQIYTCKAKPDKPGQNAWSLKAPQADLFDKDGNKIGKHYAGPTWESADGSKVVGNKATAQSAKAPKSSAIPW